VPAYSEQCHNALPTGRLGVYKPTRTSGAWHAADQATAAKDLGRCLAKACPTASGPPLAPIHGSALGGAGGSAACRSPRPIAPPNHIEDVLVHSSRLSWSESPAPCDAPGYRKVCRYAEPAQTARGRAAAIGSPVKTLDSVERGQQRRVAGAAEHCNGARAPLHAATGRASQCLTPSVVYADWKLGAIE
jgi:hypothetical protein